MADFTTAPRPSKRIPFMSEGAYLAPADLLSGEVRVTTDARGKTQSRVVWRGYAMAAARLTLTGEAWTEDDRTECAGYIAAAVMGQPSRTGSPREVLAFIAWVERFPTLARQYADAIPAERASMTHLRSHALNWMRMERRARARLEMAANHAAAREGFTPSPADVDADAITLDLWTVQRATPRHAPAMGQPHGSPREVLAYIARAERIRDHATAWPLAWGAYLRTDSRPAIRLGGVRQTASDLLAALALPRMGRAYPAALAAACSAAGMSGDEMAAAMGAPRKTAEKRARRAMDSAIPSAQTHGYLAHADIMGVTAEPETGKHHAAKREPAERTSVQGDEHCTCRATDDAPASPLQCPAHPVTSRRTRTRRPWDGKRSAEWTRSLHPQTRARMAAAAKLARAR